MNVITSRRKYIYSSAFYFVLFAAMITSLILIVPKYIAALFIVLPILFISFYQFLSHSCSFFENDSDFIRCLHDTTKTGDLVKWIRTINTKHHICDEDCCNHIYLSSLYLPNKSLKSLYLPVLEYSDVIYEYLCAINRVDSDDNVTQNLIVEFEPKLMISYEKIMSLFNDPGIRNVLTKNEAAYLFDDVTKTLKETLKQEVKDLYPSVKKIRDSRIEFNSAKNKALLEEEKLKQKIAEEEKRATQEERDQKTGVHVLQVLNKIHQEQNPHI